MSRFRRKMLARKMAKQMYGCGKNVRFSLSAKIHHPELISVGNGTTFGDRVHIRFYGLEEHGISGQNLIKIGDDCQISNFSLLAAECKKGTYELPAVELGNRVCIGHYNHISGNNRLVLEDDVLLAQDVFISDNDRNYEDISVPIRYQGRNAGKALTIGAGTFVGRNAAVMASVGKHCVIGANSVVVKEIPDYCVAVGSPARIIRRYNQEAGEWQRV